jgi:hypothetical protein
MEEVGPNRIDLACIAVTALPSRLNATLIFAARHRNVALHQEQGIRPRQPADPGKVVPARGCGQWATNRVARVSALLGRPMEGFLLPERYAAAHQSDLSKDRPASRAGAICSSLPPPAICRSG